MVANIVLFQVQDSKFVIQYMSMHILQTSFYSSSIFQIFSNISVMSS